jgi:hypothetical protein
MTTGTFGMRDRDQLESLAEHEYVSPTHVTMNIQLTSSRTPQSHLQMGTEHQPIKRVQVTPVVHPPPGSPPKQRNSACITKQELERQILNLKRVPP